MTPNDQEKDDPPASPGSGEEIAIWSFTDDLGNRHAVVVNYEQGPSEPSPSGVRREVDLLKVFNGPSEKESAAAIFEDIQMSCGDYSQVIRRDFCIGELDEMEDL